MVITAPNPSPTVIDFTDRTTIIILSCIVAFVVIGAICVFAWQRKKYASERTDMIQARLMFLNASKTSQEAEAQLDKKIGELANRNDSDNVPYDSANRVLPNHGSLEAYPDMQRNEPSDLAFDSGH